MSGGREGAGGEDGGGEALAVIAAAEGVEVATGEHERVEGAGGVTAGGVGGAEVAGVGLPDPAVGVLVRSGLLGGLQPDIGGGAPLLAGVRELAGGPLLVLAGGEGLGPLIEGRLLQRGGTVAGAVGGLLERAGEGLERVGLGVGAVAGERRAQGGVDGVAGRQPAADAVLLQGGGGAVAEDAIDGAHDEADAAQVGLQAGDIEALHAGREDAVRGRAGLQDVGEGEVVGAVSHGREGNAGAGARARSARGPSGAILAAMARRRWFRWLLWSFGALVLAVAGIALRVACILEELPTRPLVRLGPVEPVLVLRDVRVFPATGPEFLEHQDVVVEAGVIAALRATGGPLPAGARVIEGHGERTLLPGLVDAHVHLLSSGGAPWQTYGFAPEHNLEAHLYAGVTTVFDLGGFAGDLAALAVRVEAGELPGPRIFHTDQPITAPGSHPLPTARELLPWPLGQLLPLLIPAVATPTQARAAVDAIADKGVDYIKAICDHIPADSPDLDADSLQAIVAAAHARGLKAFVHIGSAEEAVRAVRAGADLLAHGVRDPLTPAQAAELARVPMVVTLAAWLGVAAIEEGAYTPSALDHAITPPQILDAVAGPAGARMATIPVLGDMARSVDPAVMQANVRLLHAAGATLLVGTDSALPGAYPGGGLHEELRLLHTAGVPVADLLLGATSRAAQVVRAQPDFGAVAPGLVADLLLIEGDPRVDIGATSRIALVVRAGRVVERLAPP